MEGKRHPSKNPRNMRVTTRDENPLTNPVLRQTIPQQKVMKGMTRLNWRRLTRIDVGN